ncbi:MAG: hypothetical protein WA294_18825 [Acidobacteriaceae bacterium]
MPNCSANCAKLSAGNGGIGIILRGGDTWHEGNSSATPYTGGTWDLYGWYGNAYGGNVSNCVYEGSQTGCLYVGVDTTWYNSANCGSWCRPILTGDNPTATAFVSSCAYQVANPGGNFGTNSLVTMPAWTILDSFELTGLCASAANTANGNTYVGGWASGGNYKPISMLENSYLHGWTSTSTAGTGSGSHPVTILGGGGGVWQVFDHVVIDGSDSDPQVASWGDFPWFYHMRDSIIRYISQGVGAQCHDIHDNIFEHFYYTLYDGHRNMLECNHDAGSNQSPATSTPNVVYNNVVRHFDPSFGNGEVFWFCPNYNAEYWFNNLMYDVLVPGSGQPWAIAGTQQYGDCVGGGPAGQTGIGGQFMFNNTLVDLSQTCKTSGSNLSGGAYLTVYNEHLINSPYDGPGCTGYGSSSNVVMSPATAQSQGYTMASAGLSSPHTCANDGTTPCAPMASTKATVGVGTNVQTYCTQLASYTSDSSISVDAANACKYGTTDGCSYNGTSHTMVCPGQGVVTRPTTTAWDSGAYQYFGAQAPTNLTGTVPQ